MSSLSPLQQVGLRLLRIHDLLYQKSGGRIGHRIPGVPPSLLLHTTGAKTGIARINTLTYATDAGKYYIVASLGGAPKAPGWYHNLKAHPNVAINLGTQRLAVTARPVLPEDPDYARLWKLVNDNNSGRYDAYQKKTTRPIPIVELTP